MLSAINRELTIQKANGNPLILQNDLSSAFIEPPKLRFKEIGPRIKRAIESAESEVLYIGYKLEADSDGENDLIESLESLNEKARKLNKTITVRIIVDRIDGLPSLFFGNPLPNLRSKEFPALDFQYAEHSHLGLGSYHQKLAVIDGVSAFLMSGEFSKANNYKNNYNGWVEIGTVMHGKAVENIRNGFTAAWNSKQTHVLNGKKLQLPAFTEAQAIKVPLPLHKAPVLYLYKKANGYIFKRNYLSPHTIAVKTAILNAKDSINIMMPNINEPVILDALVDAYLKGVKINIITGKYHNDLAESIPFMGGTNQQALKTLVDKLKARGVSDYSRFDLRYATDESGELVKHHGKQTLHAKLIVIDDLVIAGSSVLDKQSTLHSQEGDVCIESAEVARAYLRNIFLPEFNLGKSVYHHSDGKVITEWQDKLHQTDQLLQYVITLMETKAHELKAGFEQRVIEDILGSEDTPNSLYYLQKQITPLKAKGHMLSKQDVHNMMTAFSTHAKTKILENDMIKQNQIHQPFFHKIFRFITDGLKRIFSQHVVEVSLCTPNFLNDIGQHTVKQLHLFAPAQKTNIEPQASCEFRNSTLGNS